MPNWCENDLQITGPDVKKVLAAIGNPEAEHEDQKVIDFNLLIPYPEKFREQDKKAHEFNEKRRELGEIDSPEKQAALDQLLKEYEVPEGSYWAKDGYNSGGYEWCIESWGTKWNACHVEPVDSDDEWATITFDTAWSPPTPVIRKMSEMFPDHEFLLEYFECGVGYAGEAKYVAGEEEYNNTHDYRGHRGG